MMKTLISIFLILLIIMNCQSKTSYQLNESEKKLAELYFELIILKEQPNLSSRALADSTKKLIQSHGYTYEDYQACLQSLNSEPEHWEAFYQVVLDKLKDESQPTPNTIKNNKIN